MNHTNPPFAVGDQVQVIAAPESGGVYARLVGRPGQVTAVHDYRPHRLPVDDLLFDVQVPGYLAMPFSADELLPDVGAPAAVRPDRLACTVCSGDGPGRLLARSALTAAALRSSGRLVVCPVCSGRQDQVMAAVAGLTSSVAS